MTTLHFIRPYFLLLFFPLVGIWIYVWRRTASGNAWWKVCDPHLLKVLLMGETALRRWPLWTLALAWFIAVLALSGPSWQKLKQPVYRTEAGRVIVLNLSQSMYARDIKPSRIARAKFKVLDLLKRIHEGQVGMVVFSGEPYVVSPLTEDAATIASMVPVLSPKIVPVSGDDVSWALKKAGQLIKNADLKKGNIILITDDSGGASAIKEAKLLEKQGIKTNVLGLGTLEGAPATLPKGGFLENQQGKVELSKLNVVALESLANAGDGTYVSFTENNNDINALLRSTNPKRTSQNVKETKVKTMRWADEGHWLILLLLPLFLFGLRWVK